MTSASTANYQAELFNLCATHFSTYHRRMNNLINNKDSHSTLLSPNHLFIQQ